MLVNVVQVAIFSAAAMFCLRNNKEDKLDEAFGMASLKKKL